MYHCQICNHDIEPFISFGKMPIANGFLREEDFPAEYFFELKAGFCPSCHMVQLLEFVDRERMFHDQYAFFSSTSAFMKKHFAEFAENVMRDFLAGTTDPLVVEIGSNDGILLQNFASRGMRHLGVEPSANVAAAAREKGVESICSFFDEETARQIVAEKGQADAILAANVMCHIPYLHSVADGIKQLLKPGGVFIFQDPYMGDILEKTSYDQIYDEHAFYFSLASVSALFAMHELEVVHLEHYNVHGGSMRYFLAHKGTRPVSPAVTAQRDKELLLGLHRPESYDAFRLAVERSREDLMTLLVELRREGHSIVGYAATSKSTTVTNYCGITPEHLDYISDTTPIKQGKFSPGTHIPVRPYGEFAGNYPDYSLLFGWNHAEEIMGKEKEFLAKGGRWIVYVPEVKIIK